ncbi:Tetraketide alpha-pyrone reductase 2-like protein [Drosera capensis]
MKGAKDRLRLIKADLMVEGSFDEAVTGVDGMFHAASPVLVPYDDGNAQATLVDPCVKGTLNVLKSCKKATSVKRVVLTSSCSAIRYREDASIISPLSESHWSDPDYCKQHQTMAEKAAWEVAKESGLDPVVVNPSFVVGPLLMPLPTSTLLLVLGIIKGVVGEYPHQWIGFVHIDDAVAAHILAMEETNASGRLICSGSVAHWSEIMDMLRTTYPSYQYENKCGGQRGDDKPHSMDTIKIARLGLTEFKTIHQMSDDCIRWFQDKGFL